MKKENEMDKSKSNILDYFKELNVTAGNKHEEKNFDNYILSTIMITTIFNSINEYSIYMLCLEKENKVIYSNLFEKSFADIEEAIDYYNNLKSKMYLYEDKDIKELVSTLQ